MIRIEKLKEALLTFILLVDMRVFHTLLAPRGETSDAANVNSQVDPLVLVIVVLSNLLLFVVVLPNTSKVVSVFVHNALISMTVLMIILSVTWSVDSSFSLRRVVLFLSSTIAAVYLGQRYHVDDIQRIFRNVILVMLIASLLLFVVSPDSVLDPSNPGALRGLVGHKNNFGLYIGLLAVVFLAGGMGVWRRRGPKFFIFALTMALLYLSHSSTASISFAGVAGVFPLLRILQRRPSLLLPKVALGVILAAPLVLTFTGGLDSALGVSVGKDATMTGRTKLWVLLIDAIAQKPIQGYGYDAYLGSQGPEWSDTTKQLQWLPAHAHSGYIQIALSVGLVGLAFFIVLLTRCFSKAMTFARENPGREGLFPLGVLLYLTLHNLTETTFLESSGLANILFFAIYVSMSLHPRLASAEVGVGEDQFGSSLLGALPTPNAIHLN